MLLVARIRPEETLDLRGAILRPGYLRQDSQFPGDLGPLAGHFGVFEETLLVGVGSVYPELCLHPDGDEAMKGIGAWRLRGMATLPEFQSRGVGTRVLEACLEHARQASASLVWCNARTGALKFYLRNGFVAMSGEYDLPGIGPHYLLKNSLKKSS